MDDLMKTLRISAAGMRAQGSRLRVISENVANASSLPKNPGDLPYRRKVITFKNTLDRSIGLETVKVARRVAVADAVADTVIDGVAEGGSRAGLAADPGRK